MRAQRCERLAFEAVEFMLGPPAKRIIGDEAVADCPLVFTYHVAQHEREGGGDRNCAWDRVIVVGHDRTAGGVQHAADDIPRIVPANTRHDHVEVVCLAVERASGNRAQIEPHRDRQAG